jgi:hypothetical protein
MVSVTDPYGSILGFLDRRRDSNIYLVFSMSISRPTSLLASIKVSVLSPSTFMS